MDNTLTQENRYIQGFISDNALSEILCNFDINFINDIILRNISKRFRPYSPIVPSLESIENSFNNSIPSGVESYQKYMIDNKKNEIYNNILNIIEDKVNIQVTIQENSNLYTTLYYVYDFFVSNFTEYIISFFVSYININKDSLLNALNYENTKQKDSSLNYSKKINMDDQIGLLFGHASEVITNICYYDIDIKTLLDYTLKGSVQYELLLGSIQEKGNIFKEYFVPYVLNSATKPDVVTNVQLNLLPENNII